MQTIQARFDFPGFTLKQVDDNATHEVEIGSIQGGTFVLKLIRSKQMPNGDFLLSEVMDSSGKTLWNFRAENYNGLGILANANGEPVIAFVQSGRFGKLERVYPLSRLMAGVQPNLKQQIALKQGAAEYLDRDVIYTPSEDKVLKLIEREQRRVQTLARVQQMQSASVPKGPCAADIAAQRAAEHEAREEAKRQRVAKLFARELLTVYNAAGEKYHGTPVTVSEWPSLPQGSRAVLVRSYDDQTREAGEPIEAFIVLRQPGKNPMKQNVTQVFAAPLSKTSAKSLAPELRPLRTVAAMKGDDIYEVALYESMDLIRQAREAGLNSGSMVAVEPEEDEDTIQVLEVHHSEVKTIGKFQIL